jgi:hypothetical protein
LTLISVLECSLAAWRAENLAKEMGIYSQSIHCLEDGSYDPLQCDDSHQCTCLQTDSNIPGPDRVNETGISDKLKCCKHVYFNERIVSVKNLLAQSLLVLFSINISRY